MSSAPQLKWTLHRSRRVSVAHVITSSSNPDLQAVDSKRSCVSKYHRRTWQGTPQNEQRVIVQIEAELKEARESPEPPIEDLWNNIYVDGLAAKLRPIEIGKPKIQL